ncbi:hypothetical protein Q4560_00090 [Celeribacter halophilus]|uniref:hypothetical protein n=1 Tax=Celeribacter halophilus TaxID=576117 RepID=UPI0026E45E8D|nr:hypothetical protein [Celeribacter halophilus]MDO6721655.1 hypothetical protein [Celeribacter halophilus]
MSYQTQTITMTLKDVHDWTVKQNNKDYANAINRASDHFSGRPLNLIPADIEAIKKAMPLTGFNPALAKTEKAYKARRRKIIAAVKGAIGELAAERERRGRKDDWTELLERMQPYAEDRNGNPHHAVLIPVRKLANLARIQNLNPSDLRQDWINAQRKRLTGNEFTLLQKALKQLNLRRDIPGIGELLPPTPFQQSVKLREQTTPGVPRHLANEINIWVTRATCSEYDPVEECYVRKCSDSDIAHKRAALRKYVSALHSAPETESHKFKNLRQVFTPEHAISVVRHWTALQNAPQAISRRTASEYLKSIYVVMLRNDVDPSQIKSTLSANRFLRAGKQDSIGMSESTRKFCETLLEHPNRTMKFLSMHVQLRNQANNILMASADRAQALSHYDRIKVRQIGTLAAISAIETRGAPIRISNALSLRIFGEDRNFLLPTRLSDQAVIDLAAEDVKNCNAIWAPITRGNLKGLEVIEWYLEHIRPFYPRSKDSPFLFPGTDGCGSLRYKTFLDWCKQHTRAYGLPMTPHKFRHGLASLLLQHNPGRWDLLERLLDDTPETVRKNYAWVNERAKRNEVQKYILDLSEVRTS